MKIGAHPGEMFQVAVVQVGAVPSTVTCTVTNKQMESNLMQGGPSRLPITSSKQRTPAQNSITLCSHCLRVWQ